MSPQAIQSLIDMFGVEHGVQILNLFTAPGAGKVNLPNNPHVVEERPKELIRDAVLLRPVD